MFLDKPEYCLNLSKITGVYLDPEYIFFDKPTKGMYYDSYYISNNRMIMISVLKYITLDYIHDLSYPESIKILIREFDMFISKLIDYKRNSTLQREISRNVDFFKSFGIHFGYEDIVLSGSLINSNYYYVDLFNDICILVQQEPTTETVKSFEHNMFGNKKANHV